MLYDPKQTFLELRYSTTIYLIYHIYNLNATITAYIPYADKTTYVF